MSRSEIHPQNYNVTFCCPGYQKDQSGRCVSFCHINCVNGDCDASNTCVCRPGYVSDPANYTCMPELPRTKRSACVQKCTNGVCNCSCEEGYVLDPKNSNCQPKCSQSCINGFCEGPDKCACKPGFTRDVDNRYAFVCKKCPKSCTRNGACAANDTCVCNEGYFRKAKYKCVPKCSFACRNGRCTQPETCKCNENFYPDPGNKYKCLPKCRNPCINGVCTDSDFCTCKPGYGKDPQVNYLCRPVTCPFGQFFDPNDRLKCVRYTCGRPCENGTCVGNDTCSCKEGYVFSKSSRSIILHRCSFIGSLETQTLQHSLT